MFVMSTGGLLHTEVCIGLDIAHFPSLMYGFIMQQVHIHEHTYNIRIQHVSMQNYYGEWSMPVRQLCVEVSYCYRYCVCHGYRCTYIRMHVIYVSHFVATRESEQNGSQHLAKGECLWL